MNTKQNKIESAKLKNETEKAFLLSVEFGDEARKDIWFPKSQIQKDGDEFFASDWILKQKEDDFHFQTGIFAAIV